MLLFLSQVEFQRFFPLIYDDFPDSLRRMDRAVVGLHAGRNSRRRNQNLLLHIFAGTCHGKFYGSQSLSCSFAQQF